MNASDIMVSKVVKVLEGDTIRTVLDKFVSHRIGGMPIVNHCNEIKGYISDGDIMRGIGSQSKVIVVSPFFISSWLDTQTMEDKYRDMMETTVMEIATKKVVTVSIAMPADEVASILGRRHLKKVVVEKNGGYLAGIISRGDMMRFLNDQFLHKRLS
ncbi:CBS domain-containing protein [Paenibacillus sp. SYP-B3998]|uniref:CBS domain-containing protein n=1 Tax=Paenibacillus sp. SYP-B3998 TaxID=2678564 RepID=A0A6G4A227_9BACL|nr:CBS domain-containing protein [Paenibacillus sp. SYP-B3998]NEW07994.1 CBS domain-containing protein [Paenibacillus sp. SYP-B3998]